MRNTSWSSLVAVAATAFLSSCASVNTVQRQDPVGNRQMVPDRRVITDQTLDRMVSVIGVNEATISTGLLKIQVELLNRSTSSQNFAYLIEWFDANGMIVSSTSSRWMNRQILPGQTVDITAIAPSESVKDFRIQLARK
ncbi:MAG TPA: YcfL family protein [Verrucomicrobiae bacterium]|nr:YcfL family protein [Verrucomicrobiae bacterium]